MSNREMSTEEIEDLMEAWGTTDKEQFFAEFYAESECESIYVKTCPDVAKLTIEQKELLELFETGGQTSVEPST
jgi:hypothetical protein